MTNPSTARDLRAWEAAGYVVLAVVATMGVQTAGAAAVALIRDAPFTDAAVRFAYDPALIASSQFLGFGVAIVALLRRFRGEDGVIRVHVRVPGAAVLWAMLAGVGLQLPLAEIGNVMGELVGHDPEHQLALRRMLEPHSVGRGIAVTTAFVFMSPMMEEALFRGMLLPSLERRHGAAKALLLTSLLFAIIHGRPTAMAYAFAAGLILGAIRLRTGNTVVCVATHAAINAVPVLLPWRVLPIEGLNVVSPDVLHVPLPWLLPSIAIAVVGLVGIARARPPAPTPPASETPGPRTHSEAGSRDG